LQVFKELSVLGLISLIMFFIQSFDQMDEDWLLSFEYSREFSY
jgi:hypothetical protein